MTLYLSLKILYLDCSLEDMALEVNLVIVYYINPY